MRSLLPQLIVLALSFARAVLSSDDPCCDFPKAVWEREGLKQQNTLHLFGLREGPQPVELKLK